MLCELQSTKMAISLRRPASAQACLRSFSPLLSRYLFRQAHPDKQILQRSSALRGFGQRTRLVRLLKLLAQAFVLALMEAHVRLAQPLRFGTGNFSLDELFDVGQL